jgi:Na+(H+)/acetate symporter ActP
MPQFQGAGLTLHTVTGAPRWTGELVVAIVVISTVASGGMRSITFVQAFQYWLKITAILVPATFLAIAWHSHGSPALTTDAVPHFRTATTVTAPTNLTIKVTQPVTPRVAGRIDNVPYTGVLVRLGRGEHRLTAGTRLDFAAGGAVPVRADLPSITDRVWAKPLSNGRDHSLFATYSLIIATLLGTMGLPHILVRFYTNPDGRAARRTTLSVLLLLGLFYLGPTLFGALGRVYTPDLLVTGRVDSVVLDLPLRMVGGTGGHILGALVTAGAFAAFLSTAAGLTMSAAAVIAQDLFRTGGVRTFRMAAVPAILVPFCLALLAGGLPVGNAVSLAFAVAASTFCPLLVLGVWWRRLSTVGAAAGMITGGLLAGGAVLATIVGGPYGGWLGVLLAEPAAITVPMAFGVMIGVSLLTPRHVPPNIHRIMVRLHVPESLTLDRGDSVR